MHELGALLGAWLVAGVAVAVAAVGLCCDVL